MARNTRLYFSNLFRLFRLYRYGARFSDAARNHTSTELQCSLPGHVAAGFLAPMAYDTVALSAGLFIHPSRRQPPRAVHSTDGTPNDDVARGPMARCRSH